MSKQDWAENRLDKLFRRQGLWRLDDSITILDVACGLSFRSKFVPASLRVGVDIYPEYFHHIESEVPYAVIKYDVRKLNEIFVPKSFDLVIATDIIEHLKKDEAISMIKQCELISRQAVVLETPQGFIPQNIDILGHGGDEWQTHRSGWEEKELRELGYQTFTRDYTMTETKRHTKHDVDTQIKLIDAIIYV